jgi:hypothetical protein
MSKCASIVLNLKPPLKKLDCALNVVKLENNHFKAVFECI